MKKVDLNELMKKIEIRYVTRALKHANGNITEASKLINVNRTTLIMMMKRLNIYLNNEERIKPNKIKNNESKPIKKIINIETVNKVDVTKLDSRMLKAYSAFSNMTKQQKIDIVMPLNDLPVDEINNNKLEKRFEFLIHSEYKDNLIRKLGA